MSASIRLCLSCSKQQRVFPQAISSLWCIPVRTGTNNKHYDWKWRKQRAAKFIKMDLPNYNKMQKESKKSPDELRSLMKKKNILPPRSFTERPLNISATNSIFEKYIPPEGDGVASIISGEGAKQRVEGIGKKGKSFMQMRKIRQFDEDFNSTDFPDVANDIYLEANRLLEDIYTNEDRLHDLVTEFAYPKMVWLLEKKTFRWNFLESVEFPRVVHIRTTEMMSKENLYAQVTVRFHTKQTLAIYDRFGRLTFGSEHQAKNVLEYVVFEKHISDEYGRWRIHDKIVPDWMPAREPVMRTMRKPNFEPVEQDDTPSGDKKAELETAIAT